MREKIVSAAALSRILSKARSRGKQIVFTNGCFDILHVGHVVYLAKAGRMGDILVIGLNSDGSVKRLKGASRPLNSQRDRAAVLSALSFVDYVTIFDEDTPESLIRRLKPDVLVKGGDWSKEIIAGADFVKAHGGKVKIVPFVKGYSTSAAIEKMKR